MRRHTASAGATRLLVLVALAWTATACSSTISSGTRTGPVISGDQRVQTSSTSPSAESPGKSLDVPPGHLPPPGKCRVWFPGRPPGRQAKAESCNTAMANAPAGSWVLYRPGKGNEVHARVIDSRRPGVVVSVKVYEAAKGRYLRTENPQKNAGR